MKVYPFGSVAHIHELEAELDRLRAALDAATAERATLEVHLANISGALVDAGTVKVGDEGSYADGVRKLTAERDTAIAERNDYRDIALKAVEVARRQAIKECIAVVERVYDEPVGISIVTDALRAILAQPPAEPEPKVETAREFTERCWAAFTRTDCDCITFAYGPGVHGPPIDGHHPRCPKLKPEPGTPETEVGK